MITMFDLIAYWLGITVIAIATISLILIGLTLIADLWWNQLKKIMGWQTIMDAIKLYRQTHPEKFKDELH